MVAQLSGVEFHQYIPPSISIPLGYLEKGKYAPIIIESIDDIHAVIDELINSIKTVALPFMSQCTSPEQLARALQESKAARLNNLTNFLTIQGPLCNSSRREKLRA